MRTTGANGWTVPADYRRNTENGNTHSSFGMNDNQESSAHKGNTGTSKHTAPKSQSELIVASDMTVMGRAVRKYPMYVNKYFIRRAKLFLDDYARNHMELEFYWGRVEFAADRGQIRLHILGIAKNKAYLNDFYRAKTEEEKIEVLNQYTTNVLDMTADIELDPMHVTVDKITKCGSSPLGIRFSEFVDRNKDHVYLVQDCMLYECNTYCLGREDEKG